MRRRTPAAGRLPLARLAAAWCLLLAAGLATVTLAAEVPPRPAGPGARPVVDAAGALTPEQTAALDARLGALYRETGVTAGVLTVRSVAPETIDQFAVRAFEAWRLGEAGRDDGVLLVVAVEDRRARIETGYGIEGVLPDGRVGALLDRYALPRFREGAYGEGIVAVMNAVADVLVRETPRGAPPRRPAPAWRPAAGWLVLLIVAAVVFSWIFGGPGSSGRRLGPGGRRYARGPVILPGGFGGFGGGSRGGGWGGFGGRSGGGGASRGW